MGCGGGGCAWWLEREMGFEKMRIMKKKKHQNTFLSKNTRHFGNLTKICPKRYSRSQKGLFYSRLNSIRTIMPRKKCRDQNLTYLESEGPNEILTLNFKSSSFRSYCQVGYQITWYLLTFVFIDNEIRAKRSIN